MIKFASLLAFATLALSGIVCAQEPAFNGPLADRKPKPAATATPAAAAAVPGKKMVGDAMTASDEKGKSVTASFPAGTTTIYLVTKNVSGAKGDKVRTDWVADDVGKALPKGKRFYNSAVDLPDTGSYNPNFHVTGPIKGVFPAGKYHVDVFVGKDKLKTASFAVQ